MASVDAALTARAAVLRKIRDVVLSWTPTGEEHADDVQLAAASLGAVAGDLEGMADAVGKTDVAPGDKTAGRSEANRAAIDKLEKASLSCKFVISLLDLIEAAGRHDAELCRNTLSDTAFMGQEILGEVSAAINEACTVIMKAA